MNQICAFSYDLDTPPTGYVCGGCGLATVRLWRTACSSYIDLACATCAGLTTDLPDSDNAPDFRVPAVPTEDGSAFWGYTSVPRAGVEWWYRLPCAFVIRGGREALSAAEARETDAKRAAEEKAWREKEAARLSELKASTEVAVMATDYERMALWRTWHDNKDGRPRVTWACESIGCVSMVGEHHGDPIYLAVTFAVVNSMRVAFLEVTSTVSNADMVKKWISTNMPKATVISPMNFDPWGLR